MIEPALIGLRAIQYGAAAVVLGVPAFLLYSRAALAGVRPGWPVPMVRRGAAILLLATIGGLLAQTALMTGALAEAFRPETLGVMVSGTAIGAAYVARAFLAFLVLAMVLVVRPGAPLWAALTVPAVLIAASFAWTGHGAATEGAWRWPHLAADIVHAIAALVWVGAVAAFVAMARPRGPASPPADGLAGALAGFAGVGTVAVTALLLSGLVNIWVLVGPDALPGLLSTPWGLVLSLKLVAFLGMLALAALHRFRVAPQMLASPGGGLPAALRLSLGLELALGLTILVLVGIMGVLPPPASL